MHTKKLKRGKFATIISLKLDNKTLEHINAIKKYKNTENVSELIRDAIKSYFFHIVFVSSKEVLDKK